MNIYVLSSYYTHFILVLSVNGKQTGSKWEANGKQTGKEDKVLKLLSVLLGEKPKKMRMKIQIQRSKINRTKIKFQPNILLK